MIDKINITVQHSIIINRTCEEVFDFTQDFSKRILWDKSIIEYKIVSDLPQRRIFIKSKGGITTVLEYKLFNRPGKTSLRMTEINSSIVTDGGGSWMYEKQSNGSTLWTQTNTLSLKNSLIGKFLKNFVENSLRKNTIKAMQKAKEILEK